MYRRHPFLTTFVLVAPFYFLIGWLGGELGWPTGITVLLLFLLAMATGPFATRDPEPPRRRRRRP